MVQVSSEVGRLRSVLVHEPGTEVDRMAPEMMEELLFDDILFGDAAREEHAIFRRTLQLLGIEVLEASSLLVEALNREEARRWVLDVVLHDLPGRLRDRLAETAPGELAEWLVVGLRREGLRPGIATEDLFEVAPLPNWCFQRDPQIVLGDGVVFSAMAAPARHREAMLSRIIFRHHPRFATVPVLCDPLETARDHPLFVDLHRPRLEGGDLLVLSPEVLAIGLSERTNRTAVLPLARTLARTGRGPRWILAVELPPRRAYMHLDTLITPVDRDACLVYPPVILPQGPETAAVFVADLESADPEFVRCEDLLGALRARGVDLEPIPCGGLDPLRQQREQWTDGANALALAPGVITLYDRNVATAEELETRGFRIVRAKDLLLGREEVSLDAPGRVCILMPSHEMSRARGGPHCLSHPLRRDPPA